MKKLLVALCMLSAGVVGAEPAMAKKPADLTIREHPTYGDYLTTGKGLALYLFSGDVQAKDGHPATINCHDTCLEIWTPFFATGEPVLGAGVNRAKIGTVELGQRDVTTYNGWPLYRYISDNVAGETDGQFSESFNARWYLVSPGGSAISVE